MSTAASLKGGRSTRDVLESTSSDPSVGNFVEKRGPGMLHIAYRVKDIDAELAKLREQGVKMIDEQARIGAGDARIAFLHPKAAGGVLGVGGEGA